MMNTSKQAISIFIFCFWMTNIIAQDIIPANQIWYEAKHKIKIPKEVLNDCLVNRTFFPGFSVLSHTYKKGKGIIVFDKEIKSIGGDTFSNLFISKSPNAHYELLSVKLPNSVTEIETDAFSGCWGLTSMELPNHIKEIAYSAFSDCVSLARLHFPKSVKIISAECLNECRSLSEVSVDPENLYYDSRDNCNAVIHTATNSLIIGCSKTVISETVTKISKGAFHGSGLKSIVIPSSVTSIEIDAFTDCPFLERVKVKWETPLELHNAEVFDYVDLFLSNTILYVPKGTKEKYKSAEGWKDFRNIVEYDN